MRSAVALLMLLGVLAACDDGSADRIRVRLLAAQARVDPPELWRVTVVGEARNGNPVLVCGDQRLRSSFRSIVPATGAKHCSGGEDRVVTSCGERYRCSLDGADYEVATSITGDESRDFLTRGSIHAIAGDRPDYARTLRFERLGRCPTGWNIGDTTDQAGRHISSNVWAEAKTLRQSEEGPAPLDHPR